MTYWQQAVQDAGIIVGKAMDSGDQEAYHDAMENLHYCQDQLDMEQEMEAREEA